MESREPCQHAPQRPAQPGLGAGCYANCFQLCCSKMGFAASWGLVCAMLQVGGALGLSSSVGSRAAYGGVQPENHGWGFPPWREMNTIGINVVQMHQTM